MNSKKPKKKDSHVPTVKRKKAVEDISLEISLLYKISAAIARRVSAAELMKMTLEMLSDEMGLLRGTITMREGDYLFTEAAHGLSFNQMKKGVYRLNEGFTGKVAQTGESVAILDVSKNPEFLNRTRRDIRSSTSFICVPIMYMEQVIGTFSIDRPMTTREELARDLKLLETISNILADALSPMYLRQEDRNRLLEENRQLRSELNMLRPPNVIGNSGAMQEVYKALALAATNAPFPVFISGKSGTGKELLSRSLVKNSKSKNFGVVNCAALSRDGREIFGYVDANTKKRVSGMLEEFDGGLLFFDESAEISRAVQEKIFEFLQTSKFSRVGEKDLVVASVRLIFASAADVESLAESGEFMASLYSEISKNSIHIPSLSDRKSDIILLAEYFLGKYNSYYKKNIRRISTPAINMMISYPWPGNVRELETCIERAVISSSDSAISGHNLPYAIRSFCKSKPDFFARNEDIDFSSMVASFERELITDALKASRGNAAAAARELKISERMINYKIKKYSVVPSWYKMS